jgi:phospholipase/carboxylesterase
MALTGPTLAPLRGPATHLVVLVHGYGADGNDLIGLASHWQSLLPTVAFAAPNAPTPVPGSAGYQWFPIQRIDPREMQTGVEASGPILEAYLEAELVRLNIAPENLALAGFSQGTMMALHVAPRRAVQPAAIVGFSGMLAGPPPDGPVPPVLLTHGTADSVIPPQAMLAAAAELGLCGAAVQWHLAPGMGHGIDPEGLMLAGQFLEQAFRGLLKTTGPASCVLKPS